MNAQTTDTQSQLRDTLVALYTSVMNDLPSLVEGTDVGTAITRLALIENAVKWKAGDLIAQSKTKLGKMAAYREAATALGRSTRWALELAKVAEAFPAECRRLDIEWSVYRAAANTDSPQSYIDVAIRDGLDSKALRVLAGKPQARDLKKG